MRITAKYSGKCRSCGTYFEAGEDVLWTKGDGCHHITCPEIQAEEAMEDPGNRAEREMVETEIARGGLVNADYAEIEKRVLATMTKKECGLCGSEGLCGCDEPEKGDAYLDLMEAFEAKGMEVDQIPASAYLVTDELFMGLSGIYRKRDKLLCIAPTAEHSGLLKEVAKYY